MVRLNQEEGRYRVLLIGIKDNTEEGKDSFCHDVSKNYSIPFPLLKKIVDRCPVILKKSLSYKKAEILAKTLKSFGATVSVEEIRNLPPVSLEFQELVPHQLALESSDLRKTQRGTWSVIGRARNISDETLNDIWVLVQLFEDLEAFITFEENPLPINPLPPGEASPFKVVFEGDLSIKKISVAFKNASGQPIPAVDRRKKKEWVEVEMPSGSEEGPQAVDLTETTGKMMTGQQKKIQGEITLSSEREGGPLPEEEIREEHGEDVGGISEESFSLTLEPSEKVFESSSGLLEENGYQGEEGSERVFGHEAFLSEELEEKAEEEPALGELELPPDDQEVAEASHLDASVIEEATQLMEDISANPLPSFPWIEYFRDAVKTFCQKPREIFSIWFEECRKEGEFKNSLHALLTILVHSRFDDGNLSIKALENTQRISRLITQPNLPLDEIPPLEGTPFVSGEVWRDLFHRALPKVQQIGNTILEKHKWKAFDLGRLIQVIPHMGHQNSRMAIRWINDLIPEIVEVDFSDTPITIGEDLYRVASRLGIVDPHFDYYQDRNSMGDIKIQSFAKMAFPQNPVQVEEPMASMGREEERGGHCFPIRPRCEGCLFENFCPRLYLHFNPSEKGMRG